MSRLHRASSVIAFTGLALVTTPAAASDRDSYGSVALDTAVLGRSDGTRGDLAYWVLTTLRMHFGLHEHLSLSVGVGLPLLQLLFIGGNGNSAELAIRGLGVNLPLELRWSPRGRSVGGPVVPIGTTPVLTTAVTCALQGSCEGPKELALVYGFAAHAGLGWQWRDGSFITASYAMGHLWPGGHIHGEPALEGRYQGVWLTFAIAFGD